MPAVNPMLEIADVVADYGGEALLACMQCGTCTGVCPWNLVNSYSPRHILRQLSLEIFDRTFIITQAMQLLTTIVAFIGINSGEAKNVFFRSVGVDL